MYRRVRPHLPQLFRYLLSGGSAAFLELSSYTLMLWGGVWYMLAASVSAGIGLLSAFVFHKHFAFRKKENTGSQLLRYIVLQGCNAVAQVTMVYVFVEFFGVDAFAAKILGIGVVVSWNFFLYKFFVYA